MIGGVGALAISGLIYVLPAAAGGTWSGRMGDGGMLGGRMMGGDMAAMHDLAAPVMSQMPAMHSEVMPGVSKLLGMSTDELDKAMGEGKSLAQIAREKNVTLEDLQAVKVKGMNAFLDRHHAGHAGNPAPACPDPFREVQGNQAASRQSSRNHETAHSAHAPLDIFRAQAL